MRRYKKTSKGNCVLLRRQFPVDRGAASTDAGKCWREECGGAC